MAGAAAAQGRLSAIPAAIPENELTDPGLIVLDYIAPPPELAPFVTTFYHFRCDERAIRDVQPAALGHLIVYLAGSGAMHFPDGASDPTHTVALIGPTSQACAFEMAGPFHCVGASLSPRGWAALTGLSADVHGNRLHDAAARLGAEVDALAQLLCSGYTDGSLDAATMCSHLGAFIGARLKAVDTRHVAVMRAVQEWLGSSFDPPLHELLERLPYSARQAQRLVVRYFGVPPRQLARRYRAMRVGVLLHQPDLTDEQTAGLINLFYDQPHLIREVRHYLGRTPTRLTDGSKPILSALLDPRNFREISAHPIEPPPG